jgi:hypothetical protein
MVTPLATEAVATGAVNAAGLVVGVGGFVLTALWLLALYR